MSNSEIPEVYPCTTLCYEDEGLQYYSYLPDFGHAACSFIGDSLDEALQGLQNVLDAIYPYFKDKMPKAYSANITTDQEINQFMEFSGIKEGMIKSISYSTGFIADGQLKDNLCQDLS